MLPAGRPCQRQGAPGAAREDSKMDESAETTTASLLRRAFEQRIGADQDRELWRLLDRLIVAASDARAEEMEQQIMELCEYFPGIKPAMLVVWQRIVESGATPGAAS